MPTSVTVIVGTRKGCFLLESDGDRRDWEVRGPVLRRLARLPRDPRRRDRHALRRVCERVARRGCLAGSDLGENWELSSEGLSYGEDGDLKRRRSPG